MLSNYSVKPQLISFRGVDKNIWTDLDRSSITRGDKFLPERSVPLLGDLALPLQQELGGGVDRGRPGGEEVPGYARPVALLQQGVRRNT